MKKIPLSDLKDVSHTMLMALYFRAAESQRPDAIIQDPLAVEMVNTLDYDFAPMAKMNEDRFFTALRVRHFDHVCAAFMKEHSPATIISLGCGLDTRLQRVDDGKAYFIGVDYESVIQARQKLIPVHERERTIAGDLLDHRWMDKVRASENPILFIAEGLLMYLPSQGVRDLIEVLTDRFPGSEMVFDVMSPLSVKVHNSNSQLRAAHVKLNWGIRSDRELEKWHPGIHLLARWDYCDDPDQQTAMTGLMRRVRLLRDMNRILHYRLG